MHNGSSVRSHLALLPLPTKIISCLTSTFVEELLTRFLSGHTSSECCHPNSHSHDHSASSVESCFSTGLDSPDEKYERCIPPLSVLQPVLPPQSHPSDSNSTSESEPAPVDLDNKDGREPQRCRESAHCASHNLCVKLAKEEELLRIKFAVPHGSGEDEDEVKTVVWSGPREELLEEGAYLVISHFALEYTHLIA